MTIQKSQLVSLYNNIPLILKCFHDEQHAQWCEKALWKYRTRRLPDSQNIFLSCHFVQKPPWKRHAILNQSVWKYIYIEQYASPSLFHNLEISRGTSEPVAEELWLHLWRRFLTCTHAHMHTNHLPMKCNYYARLLNQRTLPRSLFRDGNGNFEFTILLYHLNNVQRSYKPQTKHAERMILLSSSQIYSQTYLWVRGSWETDRRNSWISSSSFFLLLSSSHTKLLTSIAYKLKQLLS